MSKSETQARYRSCLHLKCQLCDNEWSAEIFVPFRNDGSGLKYRLAGSHAQGVGGVTGTLKSGQTSPAAQFAPIKEFLATKSDGSDMYPVSS